MKLLIAILLLYPAFAQRQVKLTETAGVHRMAEPVCLNAQCWFVTLSPHESRLAYTTTLLPRDHLKVTQTDKIGFRLENGVFEADLSKQIYQDKEEDSGSLRSLLYKAFGVTLQRQPNRMHWAPSFQRSGARAYTSIATWHPVQSAQRQTSSGVFTFTREGFHADYPEIALFAEYRFFAGMPYFLFRSRLTIQKPMEMFWLRNQEMTMDDLFTHAAWPDSEGRPVILDFEARKPVLEKKPLPVDIPWVAFLNLEKGYGFGAVVLGYHASKTASPKTSINDGARNGKYWDRRMIDQTVTGLVPGDRFEEETAFVLFRCSQSAPLDEFLLWEKKLRNPIKVVVLR